MSSTRPRHASPYNRHQPAPRIYAWTVDGAVTSGTLRDYEHDYAAGMDVSDTVWTGRGMVAPHPSELQPRM